MIKKTSLTHLVLALSVVVPIAVDGSANADFPVSIQGVDQRLDRVERYFGFGWGDGYHVCARSGYRPLADLPPRTAHLAAQKCGRCVQLAGSSSANATYYHQFDGHQFDGHQFDRHTVVPPDSSERKTQTYTDPGNDSGLEGTQGSSLQGEHEPPEFRELPVPQKTLSVPSKSPLQQPVSPQRSVLESIEAPTPEMSDSTPSAAVLDDLRLNESDVLLEEDDLLGGESIEAGSAPVSPSDLLLFQSSQSGFHHAAQTVAFGRASYGPAGQAQLRQPAQGVSGGTVAYPSSRQSGRIRQPGLEIRNAVQEPRVASVRSVDGNTPR